ncbi:MAG: ribosome-binding factor A [Trichlorobacter sp.]|jgi:ribosome-binding factor A
MAVRRSDKVQETIHTCVSSILSRGLNDPRIGFVTITGVEVTVDLHLARIFYTVIGDERSRKDTAAGLKSATPYIRRELGRVLAMRYTPDIMFVYDQSRDYGERIDELLKEVTPTHDE